MKDAKSVTAAEKLRALEEGRAAPSRTTLLKMANQYRRPLIVFYMAAPPPKGPRGQDCRSTVSSTRSALGEANLDALIRRIRARQEILRSAMTSVEEPEVLPFVASCSTDDGQPSVLASIRETLGMKLKDFRAAPTPTEAFRHLREHVEAAGVFVLLEGNLGSHHTNLDADVFRGIALPDPVAPFAIVNPNDHRRSWAFTLLHELAHIWLGRTAVSGGIPEMAIERFCNGVASEYLLPQQELVTMRLPSARSVSAIADAASDFARERNISASMVAYRLHLLGRLHKAEWESVSKHYFDRWTEGKETERNRSQSGPGYYVLQRHRLGHRMLDVVRQLMASGEVTTTKAGRVLGIRNAKNVYQVLHRRPQSFSG